ncbi:hypothetical protein [Candidatus Methylocalor cossyra]|uniref:Chromosome partition protein Smc n=1 Tax=Candidatus Methylocalor cossyra TaxID=3108543 RepID=A0ABP1C664_9GAMM
MPVFDLPEQTASSPSSPRAGRLLAVAALLWASLPGGAVAQAPKSDAAIVQTLRKAQGMLRQLSQEKADLEAKNAALDERVKALEARVRQLEPLEGQVKQQKLNLEALQGSNAALQQRISGDAERLRALGERQRQLGAELEKYRRDNRLLVDAVKERGRWIEQCAGKNRSLLEVNRELLKKYRDKGFWDEFKAVEPFTGIGAVAEENAVQDFRYKLEDLEITPWREPSPPPQAPEAVEPGATEPSN